MAYAKSTTVDPSTTKGDIERTLRRYGATSFVSGWDADSNLAMIGFSVEGRQVRFVMPMPNPDDREFTHTPERGTPRSKAQATKEFEQAIRSRWRSLYLVIKAKLEAVDTGLVTFESEFAMHMLLPGGGTVADHVLPEIERAYRTGTVRPMLALGPGEDRP